MAVAISASMMEGRKPQVDLKATRTLRGPPGALPLSSAGSHGFVFDSSSPRVTAAAADAGTIELLSLAALAGMGRLELPMPPVRGTLSLHVSRGCGAVVVRDVERRDEAIILFELRAGPEPCALRVEGGVRSLAFDAEGRYLYAACHDDSALAVIDVRDERPVEQVLLAGQPYGLQI